VQFNPLSAELNPICHLLALLAHHILHISRIRVIDGAYLANTFRTSSSETPSNKHRTKLAY